MPVEVPDCPDYIRHRGDRDEPNYALECWEWLTGELERFKLIARVDRMLLELACTSYAVMREAEDERRRRGDFQVDDKGKESIRPCVTQQARAWTTLSKALDDLYATPRARATAKLPTGDPAGASKGNPHDELAADLAKAHGHGLPLN